MWDETNTQRMFDEQPRAFGCLENKSRFWTVNCNKKTINQFFYNYD